MNASQRDGKEKPGCFDSFMARFEKDRQGSQPKAGSHCTASVRAEHPPRSVLGTPTGNEGLTREQMLEQRKLLLAQQLAQLESGFHTSGTVREGSPTRTEKKLMATNSRHTGVPTITPPRRGRVDERPGTGSSTRDASLSRQARRDMAKQELGQFGAHHTAVVIPEDSVAGKCASVPDRVTEEMKRSWRKGKVTYTQDDLIKANPTTQPNLHCFV